MDLSFKKILVSSLAFSFLLGPFLSTSAEAAVIGGVCSQPNKTATINKVKVICQLKGKKLIWVAVVKPASTISSTPQSSQNLPKMAKPGKTYVVGKDLEPGYYVQEQNSPNNSCIGSIVHHYTVNGKKTLISGDFDTYLNNVGNLTHAYITIKVEDANNQKANLFIKDESGKNIISTNVTNGIHKINIASPAAGMLFIQVNDGKKNVVLKAIKQ